MPRTARAAAGGVVYHVINRGNRRMNLFSKRGDFDAFIKLLRQGCRRVPGMRVLGYHARGRERGRRGVAERVAG